MTTLLSRAVKFYFGQDQFGYDIYVESRDKYNKTWVVSNGSGVWNADNEFEWEPSPSNRDDEFIARTRFDRDTAVLLAAALTKPLRSPP